MNIGFDIISDLNLTGQEEFDWTGKPTSLFCIIPGNISSDITVLLKLFKHLSKCYQGVFFIDGYLENTDINNNDIRVKELSKICNSIPNIVYLHTNVVVVEGVALVGVNGWETAPYAVNDADAFQSRINKYDDVLYLEKTLERLQLHVDIKKIVLISNAVPAKELYFGSVETDEELFLTNALELDTENKIVKWVFGTSDKMTDTAINGVRFVNNPKFNQTPYYPKRIEVEV